MLYTAFAGSSPSLVRGTMDVNFIPPIYRPKMSKHVSRAVGDNELRDIYKFTNLFLSEVYVRRLLIKPKAHRLKFCFKNGTMVFLVLLKNIE